MDTAHRCTMKRLARLIPIAPDRLQTISAVDEDQSFGVLSRAWLQICRCAAALTSARRLLAAVLFWQKKGGAVGQTKCGKGSRIMAIADASGFPVAACLANASPHEVKFAEAAIDSMFVSETPEKLIGDKKHTTATRLTEILWKNMVPSPPRRITATERRRTLTTNGS